MGGSVAIDGLLFQFGRARQSRKTGWQRGGRRKASHQAGSGSLASGALWIYVDEESGPGYELDTMRMLSGRPRRVETFYYDWQETNGLLIPRRQESQTEGREESNFLTVDRVITNPPLDDSRFAMPATAGGRPA